MAHNKNKMIRARYRPKAENLMDQVREVLRYNQYGIRTERIYARWILEFIRFNDIHHPIEMGMREIERFLTHLSINMKVVGATQEEARSAILFLYREVLDTPLDDQIQELTLKSSLRLPFNSRQSEFCPNSSCEDC